MKKFAAILIVLALAGTVQAGVIAGNYLTNGDFDTDLSGWTAFYGAETWTSSTPDGGGADLNGTAGAGLLQDIPVATYTITQGDVLSVGVDMAGTTATNVAYFGLRTPAWGAVYWPVFTFSTADLQSGWTTKTADIVMPAGFDGDQLRLFISTWPNNHVLVDNIYITPEPVTLATLVIGAGLVAMRRRRR